MIKFHCYQTIYNGGFPYPFFVYKLGQGCPKFRGIQTKPSLWYLLNGRLNAYQNLFSEAFFFIAIDPQHFPHIKFCPKFACLFIISLGNKGAVYCTYTGSGYDVNFFS